MKIKYTALTLFYLNLIVASAFADSELDIIKRFQNIDDEHTKTYKIFQSDPMAIPCESKANSVMRIIAENLNKYTNNLQNLCLDENKQPLTGKIIIYENKDIQKKHPSFIADFIDGYPTGYAITIIHKLESIFVELYQNKKQNGESYLYNNNYLNYKWTYKDDKLDGKQTVYYPNGKPYIEWEEAKGYRSPTTFYEEDGSLYQGNKFLSDCIDANFKDGKLDGKFTAYKSDGDILFEANYERGIAVSGYCNRPVSKYSTQTEKVEFTNAHLYKLNKASMNFQYTPHYNLETMTETLTSLAKAEELNPCKE